MVVGLSAAWHSSCLHAPAPLPLSPGHQIAVYLCSGLRARIEEARIATGVHGRFADGISCERNECLDGGGRSEEHTSELQSLMRISYAVFCLKKKIIPHSNM